ncbi:carboxylesterase/lipase family protein [Qipengyuania sp. YG27]|uniref:Carboxylic ester hydrolase n=1 Tax=Qipengyuania mesophila TaxID=2867246 RepID=A0ABS7JTZ7_9SPHN|nr:carboxylesterase/lipase family protein [Qipengyuania mesophila]MBX7501120.1 carboxylesterase/lipase family protein [Qipengyuania mesophila]
MHTKPTIGILAAALCASVGAQAQAPVATPIVETQQGKVQGLEQDGVDAFLGLRYAAPPVGPLRFKPPRPVASWTGTWDATSMGAPCMQMYTPSGPNETDLTRTIQTIFPTYGEAKIDNEDCLFLNVWTPAADAQKRPVMVWFHGGGYAYGSGGWPVYAGRNLAAKGNVVVVTVNHRLNAFGYTYLGDKLGADFAESGNAGQLDLVAALEWVRDNIVAFGGDPANVTIFGESGGGSKVSHMLATPAADGLFTKAIIESGPGVTSGKKADAAKLANDLMAKLGVTTAEELQAVPADTLLEAARAVLPERGMSFGGPNFGPIVDGVVLESDPFLPAAPAQSKDVPVMIGYNKDEMTLFVASQPWFGRLDAAMLDGMATMMGPEAKATIDYLKKERPNESPTYIATSAMSWRFAQGSYIIADQIARAGGAPVYVYRLDWETPVAGGVLRTPHTLEMPFVFANVDTSRALVGEGEAPEKLEAMMSDAWIAFAKTGTPASPLIPDWPAYTLAERQVMIFDLEPEVVNDPEKGLRELAGAK